MSRTKPDKQTSTKPRASAKAPEVIYVNFRTLKMEWNGSEQTLEEISRQVELVFHLPPRVTISYSNLDEPPAWITEQRVVIS